MHVRRSTVTVVLALAVVGAQVSGAPPASAAAPPPEGAVWTWGGNAFGQLGDGTTTPRPTPGLVGPLAGVRAIAGGGNHSVAMDNYVQSWGANFSGQLGDGTTAGKTSPVSSSGFQSVHLSAGQNHSVATRFFDRSLWAWGANSYGQVGDGSQTQRNVPVQIGTFTGVKAVAAGWNHSLAVDSAGNVWAWGSNLQRQLGDGTLFQRNAPVQTIGLASIASVAAGASHSLALGSDGRVWWWGTLYDHNGNPIIRGTPELVSGLPQVTAIAAGSGHSLVIAADGSLWAWGSNTAGELGDGSGAFQGTPVRVPGLAQARSIGAGLGFSLASDADGVVWAWGRNADGQLGDGTTTGRVTPVRATGLGFVARVAAGSRHSMALVTPPSPTINSPVEGSFVTSSAVRFSGGGPAGYTVELYENGNALGRTTADGAGSWQLDVTLADGAHSPTAAAFLSLSSPESNPRAFIVDTTPPDTRIRPAPTIYSVTSVSFDFDILDANPGGATFACSLDGGTFDECTSPRAYSGLAGGQHSFRVRATDGAGLTDPSPAQHDFTVDTSPPTISILDPAPGVYAANMRVVPGGPATVLVGPTTVRARASDMQTGVGPIAFQVDGEPVEQWRVQPGAGGTYTFSYGWANHSPLPGPHTITAVVQNGAALSAEATVGVIAI